MAASLPLHPVVAPPALPYRGPQASRTRQIAPFQVMELGKQAAALQQAGHPVITLNIGEPDFKAPPAVLAAAARAAARGDTGYTPALGITALREAIAGHYARDYGLSIDPARVVVTAGASAALLLACLTLVEPGAEVLMADPSYPCNRHFVIAAGGQPRCLPVTAAQRFQPTAGLLAHHWHPGHTSGVLLASPANPTGTSIGADALGDIVRLTRQQGGFCVVDEIYLDLQYESPDPGGTRRSALDWGDDVVVINSFSKYFSMTGWRLGWLVLPPALVPVAERLAQNLYICPSALAQHAALGCFDPDSLAEYQRRRDAFRQRRDWLVPALESIGLHVPCTPDGAFYVWVDASATGLASPALAQRLLHEAWVATVPGTDFGAADPDRWLRISYATALESLQEAVQRMGRVTHGSR